MVIFMIMFPDFILGRVSEDAHNRVTTTHSFTFVIVAYYWYLSGFLQSRVGRLSNELFQCGVVAIRLNFSKIPTMDTSCTALLIVTWQIFAKYSHTPLAHVCQVGIMSVFCQWQVNLPIMITTSDTSKFHQLPCRYVWYHQHWHYIIIFDEIKLLILTIRIMCIWSVLKGHHLHT